MEPDFERFARTPCLDRLLRILWRQALELGLGLLMLEMRLPGADEDIGELGPNIGGAHIDNADRLNARLRRLDTKQGRGLAALHAAPKFALSSDNEVLVKGIGMGGDLDPFAAAGDDRQHR